MEKCWGIMTGQTTALAKCDNEQRHASLIRLGDAPYRLTYLERSEALRLSELERQENISHSVSSTNQRTLEKKKWKTNAKWLADVKDNITEGLVLARNTMIALFAVFSVFAVTALADGLSVKVAVESAVLFDAVIVLPVILIGIAIVRPSTKSNSTYDSTSTVYAINQGYSGQINYGSGAANNIFIDRTFTGMPQQQPGVYTRN
jgi:hypothetical protein